MIQSKDNKIITKLHSSVGNEIFKIYEDNEQNTNRFVVARTDKSFILCDLDFPSFMTEIPWISNGASKQSEIFIFDFHKTCILDNYGELSIVEVRYIHRFYHFSFENINIII